ncbi:23S rRNA (guanosine(2251)-2'-O)-methyltransferase RlmB [Isoptericola sp. b441]|uniref:23S rRNA (Guanosine(2251)-2'-O)-methyltransferase RlmB n=1 Tax=Actinotalea lenta TaxID=3064654 RepID=A0ABT9D721_9CELL|nr:MULTISPECIES: 23S rRNA (guanosine(2251)-2'-O)-methyltransferase RlmB [unclassified Isoptericola]MDO8106634.1 23S rRNA (guanosine(2251)-2'-O)-methyltransferase RlmB [Isoptericola sp. b441]MDO8121658.1 23S rRNA (guanosine(2251)-2'-O)-methyltransferase RlmB [Isoptericola sp. b490]
MAGNSRRRGATRKPGTKKQPTAGTGGKGRRALEGKGPTPKAEDRPYHVAHRRKVAAERAEQRGGEPQRRRPQRDLGSRTRHSGVEVVAGRNPVVEALRAGVPCTGVWLAHQIDADDRVKEIRAAVTTRHLPLAEVTRAELDRITDGLAHQGVAMQVPPYEYADLDAVLARARRAGSAPLLVALDGVTDPRNLGAVLRSAGAFGVHGVVVPERRAAGVTAAAWKVSAGAAARVPVARVTNLVRALGQARDAGCAIVGLDADGTMPVADLHLAVDPVVLVVGSEGKGLGRLVRQTCDVIASIPIASAVESLNAGVAAGIALYEVARLRGGSSAVR